MKPADELLYDSEASLRLVDHAIEELNISGVELDPESRRFLQHIMSKPGGFSELSKSLVRAYAETLGVVARMQGRPQILQQAEFDRLDALHGKLCQVTSATEVAANHILDGLGRAIATVESLDLDETDAHERRELIATLREQLYEVVAHLQFQDITAQQLDQVSNLVGEMRQRLLDLLAVFTPTVPLAVVPDSGDAAATRDSVLGSTERQAIVDETLAMRGARKTA